MVIARRAADFWLETRGVTMAEGLITFPLVVLVFAAFVEFGFATFQWNQAVKALQYGARLAAVSDPVATFDPVNAAQPSDPALVGKGIDLSQAGLTNTWSCSGDGCNSQLNRIVYGATTATACQPIAAAGTVAMCHVDPWIQKNNVVVTYERSGLGYWGRPEGAVVTIRLAVQNLTFNLPVLGALLGLNSVTVPAMPVTITSEDMKTCSTC